MAGFFDDTSGYEDFLSREQSLPGGPAAPAPLYTPDQVSQLAAHAGISENDARHWLETNPGDFVRGMTTADWGSEGGGGDDGGEGGGVPVNQTFASPAPYTPFTEQFVAPTAPTDLMDKWEQTFSYDPSRIADDPGYQFRQDEERKALERSAAARGTLLTGGTAAALQDRAANVAAQFMGDDFNRALGTYQTNYNTFAGDRTRRSNEFDKTYGRAADEYKTRYDIHQGNELNRYGTERSNLLDQYNIFDTNRNFNEGVRLADWNMNRTAQNDAFNQLFQTTELGQRPLLATINSNTDYGRTGADIITGQANANAAAQAGQGSGWDILGQYGTLGGIYADAARRRAVGQ